MLGWSLALRLVLRLLGCLFLLLGWCLCVIKLWVFCVCALVSYLFGYFVLLIVFGCTTSLVFALVCFACGL